MKRRYTPYNFDENYEYRIYSQIGKEYYRKWMGKKTKQYGISFDKYTEWVKYFQEKYLMNDHNTCNFLHYLNEVFWNLQKFEEYFKALVIPCYMTLITIMLTVYSTMEFSQGTLISTLIISVLAVISICTFFLRRCSNKIKFYEDCIKVVDDNKASQQSNLADTANL